MIIRRVPISSVSHRYVISDLTEGDIRLLAVIAEKAAPGFSGFQAGMVIRLSALLNDAASFTATHGIPYISGVSDAEMMFRPVEGPDGPYLDHGSSPPCSTT